MRQHDWEAAVPEALKAGEEFSHDSNVLLSAVFVIYRYMGTNGWNEELNQKAERFYIQAKSIDPSNPKFTPIDTTRKHAREQYGISN